MLLQFPADQPELSKVKKDEAAKESEKFPETSIKGAERVKREAKRGPKLEEDTPSSTAQKHIGEEDKKKPIGAQEKPKGESKIGRWLAFLIRNWHLPKGKSWKHLKGQKNPLGLKNQSSKSLPKLLVNHLYMDLVLKLMDLFPTAKEMEHDPEQRTKGRGKADKEKLGEAGKPGVTAIKDKPAPEQEEVPEVSTKKPDQKPPRKPVDDSTKH